MKLYLVSNEVGTSVLCQHNYRFTRIAALSLLSDENRAELAAVAEPSMARCKFHPRSVDVDLAPSTERHGAGMGFHEILCALASHNDRRS